MKKKITLYCFLVMVVCYGFLNTTTEEMPTLYWLLTGLMYLALVLGFAFFLSWFDDRYREGKN